MVSEVLLFHVSIEQNSHGLAIIVKVLHLIDLMKIIRHVV